MTKKMGRPPKADSERKTQQEINAGLNARYEAQGIKKVTLRIPAKDVERFKLLASEARNKHARENE